MLPRPKTRNKTPLYSDFEMKFETNPITSDLTIITNERAINSALRNLLTVERGEYLMQPTKGSGLGALLFENKTPALLKIVKTSVETVIKQFEPRASLISVDVVSELDSNQITVRIVYQPINTEDPITTEIVLERSR